MPYPLGHGASELIRGYAHTAIVNAVAAKQAALLMVGAALPFVRSEGWWQLNCHTHRYARTRKTWGR